MSDQNGGAILIMALGMSVLLMSMMVVMNLNHQQMARAARQAGERMVREQLFHLVLEHMVSRMEYMKIAGSETCRMDPDTLAGYRILPVKIAAANGDGLVRLDIRIESLHERPEAVYGWSVELRCEEDACRIVTISDHDHRNETIVQEAEHEQR